MDRDKLKHALFEAALKHHKKFCEYRDKFGKWDRSTSFERARYQALFDVITRSGLEYEYLFWVEEQDKREATA